MTKKSDAPAIRFKGFSDAWEQRKFSDVVATRRGLTYKPSDIRKNGVRVLRSSNIAEDSFVLSDEDVFVVREAVNIDCVRANDILITAANGSSRLVGKHTIISGIPEESAVHGGFMLLGTTKEPHFVNASMGSSWYRRFIELFVAGGNGAIGNLNKNDLDNQDIAIPSEKEQKKIGSFFRQLDNLITLHQRKCVFLFGFFQAFISMIFTASTFSWEQRKLGELVDRVVRKNTNNESTLPLTISAQYGLVDQITYFNNRVASRDVSNYYLVLNGEFAYNKSTSDGYPFGAVKRLDLYEKGVLSTLYIVFAPKKEQQIDSDYLTVFFDTDRWHKGVAERAAEGARNHGLLNISAEDFFDIDLSVPKDIVEQKQIGAFIRQLDNLITLHQRKFEKLTNVKKSMLEKMFPQNGSSYPEIRFKGFTDPWEQRKVGDLLIERNQQAPMSDEYPLMAFIANEGVAPKGERYDRSALVTDTVNKLYKKTEKGDFIYSSNNLETGSIGLNKYGKACISPVYSIYEPTGIADSDFLGRRLVRKDFINAMVKWRQGVIYGQWRIHESDFLKIEITVPSVEEQRKIGAYFDQLDNLITLHQRKGKAAVTGCSNDANNSKGVYCKARDFGYKCCKKVEFP